MWFLSYEWKKLITSYNIFKTNQLWNEIPTPPNYIDMLCLSKKCLLPYFVWFSSPYTLEIHFLPHHVSKDHEAKFVHPSSLRALHRYWACPHRQHGFVKSWCDKSNKQTNLIHINRNLQKNHRNCKSYCLWKNLMCLNKLYYGKGSNPITNRDEPDNTQNPCLPN